jgi:hypothetical protein
MLREIRLRPQRYWRWTFAVLPLLFVLQSSDARVLASTYSETLTISNPVYNAVVGDEQIVIQGSASSGDTVRYERRGESDPQIPVDALGNWEYSAKLKEGKNAYTFHLESSDKDRAKVVVFYNPGAVDALVVVDPPGLPSVGSQDLTIRGKAKPGDTVFHEKTRAKDAAIPVDADGNWGYQVKLKKGENNYTFHLASSESTKPRRP